MYCCGMTPFIHTVTVTGIDCYTNRDNLCTLQDKYPFVEWGVLLSQNKAGKENRYPSLDWIADLKQYDLRLSGHLCGRWARNIAHGGAEFVTEHPNLVKLFKRIQLNISNILNDLDAPYVRNGIVAIKGPKVIVQLGRHNNWQPLLAPIIDSIDLLYDYSGGRGILPGDWPRPAMVYDGKEQLLGNCGYAGGLRPDNIENQIELIQKVVEGQSIWIDAESGVRTDDVFDLAKVANFLDAAQPYVKAQG